MSVGFSSIENRTHNEKKQGVNMSKSLMSKLSLEDELSSTVEPVDEVSDDISNIEIDTSNTGDDSELNEAER